MAQFIVWFIAVELLGLAALPLTLALFPRLPDRGYAFAKVIGILVITWLNWLLGLAIGAANIVPLLWALAVALGALGVVLLRAGGEDIRAVVASLWRIIAVEEAVFIGAFVVWTLVRAYHPDIYGTEKPMDLMYLTTSMRHGQFPPPDLWLHGTTVNYYYLGYMAMATVATMAGVPATVAFNLALALVFGLTLSGAYAVGRTLTRSPLWALLAAFLVGAAGNLTGWTQALGNIASPTPNWGGFNWCASRVIGGCGTPTVPYSTITEFPFFSFVWGDLHPHVIALPFALLCVGLALHAALAAGADEGAPVSRPLTWTTLAFSGLAACSLYAINSWDLPAYLLLIVAAYIFGPFARGRSLLESLRAAAPSAGIIVALSVLLWLPFWLAYRNSAHGIGFKAAGSSVGEYLLVNGAFYVPILLLLGAQAWPAARRWLGSRGATLAAGPSPSLGIVHGKATSRGDSGKAASREDDEDGELPTLPVRPVAIGLAALLVLAVLLTRSNLTILALLLLGVVAHRLFTRRDGGSVEATFAWLLVALGLGLTILCEFVYVRDIFDGGPSYRMNTVFKFYYDMWVVLALAAAWAAAEGWRRAARRTGNAAMISSAVGSAALERDHATAGLALTSVDGRADGDATADDDDGTDEDDSADEGGAAAPVRSGMSGRQTAWAVVIAVLVIVTGTYTMLALPNSGGSRAAVPTLDGIAYLQTLSPGDYAAISWLRDHAPADAVVAEAIGGDYWGTGVPDRPGQVSIFAGLPTLLEAANSHEGLWHPGDPNIPINGNLAAAIYGPSVAAARQAIATAHVGYVYVGPQEAATYAQGKIDAPALTKFGQFMQTVYHANGVTIYKNGATLVKG